MNISLCTPQFKLTLRSKDSDNQKRYPSAH